MKRKVKCVGILTGNLIVVSGKLIRLIRLQCFTKSEGFKIFFFYLLSVVFSVSHRYTRTHVMLMVIRTRLSFVMKYQDLILSFLLNFAFLYFLVRA